MRIGRHTRRSVGAALLALGAGILLAGCIERANRAPIVQLDAMPREGYAPLSVALDGSGTVDPDGDALSFEWSFGTGETIPGRSIVRTFAEGVHTVTLTVTDARGATERASATLTARSVPDGYVVRRYAWTHDGEAYAWDALLPYSLYQKYRGQLRTPFIDNYDYPSYVLDPLDDPTLADLADVLWNLVDGDADRFVEMTLSFVQGSIEYRTDPPDKEWPLYPMETLVDGAGDCEDTAILLVSLLRAEGVGSALAAVDTDDDSTPDHVLVLVPVSAERAAELRCGSGATLTVLALEGTLYAVAETAVGSGELGLGCDPWGLAPEDVIETWPFD